MRRTRYWKAESSHLGKHEHAGQQTRGVDDITALSAATGDQLWSAPAYVGNPNNGSGQQNQQ